MFDNFQLKLAEHWEIIIPEFNAHYVPMTGADYGKKLVSWDKEQCHHWNIVGYQKALYILTAQSHMMRFLRTVVDNLLLERSAEQASPHHPKWEQLIQNGFYSFGSSSAFRIRASANQPFSAPPVFDPVKISELIESMYQACVDELDLAQTSPSFVQWLIRSFQASLYSETLGRKNHWGVIVDEVICNLYRRLVWWRQMHKECQMMLQKHHRYNEEPTKATREDYENSVFLLHNIAIEHLAQQNLLVQYSLPFQRGFECNFEYKRYLDENKEPQMCVEDEDAFHADTLFWSIRALGFDRDRVFTLDPSFNFRVLDDCLSHASGKERNRVSGQLLRSLSEMAVVDEVRVSIECDRSWNREPNESIADADPEFRGKFIEKYAQKLNLPEIVKRGGLEGHLRSFYNDSPWPSGNVDNRWLAAASASRAHLKKFWTHFRAAVKSLQTSRDFPANFIEEDQQAFSAAHRPENVRAAAEEEQALRDMISARAASKHSTPARQVNYWPIEEPEKFIGPTIKEKKKTRPSQPSETSQEDSTSLVFNASPSLEAQPVEDPISVKSENFGLLHAMFTAAKVQMRSYSWAHFTQAMADAGCSVTQGSGSAVHFRSEKGTIVFHRPHPEPTIAQEILIAMGKRLRKRFGWTEKTFRDAKE